MDLQIGKTHYKTNAYLFTGNNSSGIVAESNINYLRTIYTSIVLNNLNMFHNDGEIFILQKEQEKTLKRPTIILLSENGKDTLFIRDDIYFKINKDIENDPVLDYKSYVKLEDTQQIKSDNKSSIKLNNKRKQG